MGATKRKPKPQGVCRHCEVNKANRPRGLCWSCFYTPGIREKYLPLGKFARRGILTGSGDGPPPCRFPPGKEKIPVLEERARLGLSLFCPGDARRDAS